jgi:large-conductance mechanosensitive channel
MDIKLAGLDTKSFKLSEVKDSLDQKEMDKVFKYGKIADHIYGKFVDGALVIFCSVKACLHLNRIVEDMKQKAKDQKKRQLFNVTVFEYSH